MKHTLSVIIPNYNKGKYIGKCIQSVLEQSLLPDEIIVVDDCSTDDSLLVLEKIVKQGKDINILRLEKNGGVSQARNAGLKAAQGEYVTFLDADDYYANQDKLINEMRLIQEKGEDIVAYSRLVFVKEDGLVTQQPFIKKRCYLEGNIFGRMLTGRFQIVSIARDYCVKRKNLLEVGGYNEDRNLYEDLELIIKLAQKYPFFCTQEWGTAYRSVPDGLSSRKKKTQKRVREEIFHQFTDSMSAGKKVLYHILWQGKKNKDRCYDIFWKFADYVIDGFHLRRKRQ